MSKQVQMEIDLDFEVVRHEYMDDGNIHIIVKPNYKFTKMILPSDNIVKKESPSSMGKPECREFPKKNLRETDQCESQDSKRKQKIINKESSLL